jgi:hypothetical protein
MEQAQWEEDLEPAAAEDSAHRVLEHDILMARPVRLFEAQAEAGFPGEAVEAGYMAAVEAAAGGVSRHHITLIPPT